ncbi:uncharacterized protein LOC129729370 [Wyeomyia smithii]|uniref:uncharacterized protein LOC129729370 n=1 Tax=Wyeomyia smithii TaxID=174621 RepID=UPI002467E649|nr:uncharacterized protein LOC129729370 [Wyeomyia smithii]
MFVTSKKLTAPIVLLVFFAMVLLNSALVFGSDAQERNHKAMTFGRAKMKNETTTTAAAIVANDDPEQEEEVEEVEEGEEAGGDVTDHNNNEHGDFDGDDVDEVDKYDGDNRSAVGPSKLLPVTSPSGVNYVATTPSIVAKPQRNLTRYEQGLEDYDEAAARVEEERNKQTVQQYDRVAQPFLTMFNVISSALSNGRSINSAGLNPATILELVRLGSARNIDNNEQNASSQQSANEKVDSDTREAENSTALAAVEGRYIKGDPLNGYYDFIITEGSYKFWAAFQVATAVLIIYSTFAAIYYSKVSPLTSDYDYIDYLNGGRSFAGSRPASGRSGDAISDTWDRLLNKPWFNVATRSFGFIMDAIERVPK